MSARAYAGLAEALRVLAQYGVVRASEAIPRAKAAIAHALEIEPGSGEALGVLAVITLTGERKRAEVGRSLRARAGSRSDAFRDAMSVCGVGIGGATNRKERARAELERAQRNDPLSSICTAHASIALTLLGCHEEAVLTAQRGHALDPDAFATQLAVASAKTWAGDLAGALPFAQSALQISGRHPWALAFDDAHSTRGRASARKRKPFTGSWSRGRSRGSCNTHGCRTPPSRSAASMRRWTMHSSLCSSATRSGRGSCAGPV